jgi:hypothetical protein
MKIRSDSIFWIVVMILIIGFISFGAINSKERRAFLDDCKETTFYTEHWRGGPTRIYDCSGVNQ